jgi:uridylate kinase
MLATVINGMALQAGLEKVGVFTRLLSAIKMEQIANLIFGAVLSGIWKKAGL